MADQKLVIYKNGDFALGEFDDDLKRQGRAKYQSTKGSCRLMQGLNTKESSTPT